MLRARLSATGARLLAGGLLVLLGGCASTSDYFQHAGRAPAVAPATLETWPHRELWTGIVFNGQKIGFTRREVRPARAAPGLYEIESEAAMRLKFLGFDKRVSLRSLERVRGDLTLESFRYRHEIDGSPLKVSGRSDGRSLEAAALRLATDAALRARLSAAGRALVERRYPPSHEADGYVDVYRTLARVGTA